MDTLSTETVPKWVTYSAVNSILCILGAFCVPLISILSGRDSNSSHNTRLVNYGLSLSAGSMVTTALYKMLPVINHENRFEVFFGVLAGISLSLFLNYIVHSFASQSLIHCAHGEDDDGEHNEHHHNHHNDDIIVHGVSSYGSMNNKSQNNARSNSIQHSSKTIPSISSSTHQDTLNRRTSIIDLINKANPLSKTDSITVCTPLLKADKGTCVGQISQASSRKSDHVESNGTDQNKCFSNNGAKSTKSQVISTNIDNIQEEETNNDNYSDNNNEDEQLQNIGPGNESYAPTDDESFYPVQCKMACMENTIGYDLENLSVYRKNYFSGNDKISIHDNSSTSSNTSSTHVPEYSNDIHSDHHSHRSSRSHVHSHHHHNHVHGLEHDLTISSSVTPHSIASIPFHYHHVETPFSKLLSIGMQTCLVLTLHKFPEGFIIFYTNKSNNDSKTIGFSIFLSLAIHNFVEGFAMTLPFYSIFENKWLSILITTVLGGGSQPLGALIGYLIFKNKNKNNPNSGDNEPNMDLLLSITSGFLLVIALQMFQTGIGFSDGHHHHEDDDSVEIRQNHSLGTTCLKWCCAGVLLILASSIFV
ncbi:similar to Saccharomyces cerevisiae YKL175W ZRT3 Vacuolar membrane zinc transporter, transports zinc from storage in the vacuole to the cytoplasm when needed [Maudiozyma saulgeensis]|uniref:Similar to Saccharomyces cerevisiae YKL175W ZRT3 Vacuolar membrane zinc transporter, transports zinc from storage in the vacuole to the cytoplasm when needed n=1 Tax=Maudiozyma saulgeensis TaxID=1789683 RepID=A0A1X7R281_9SACH|nr:similar to Saccharomyces cerevisiae YKL175W ZRT3 Vacuolar membrane zinc transporter, transports zinc from storage in the vacuole to the cytoplasm when needed [Kazachstania saulgeensis]